MPLVKADSDYSKRRNQLDSSVSEKAAERDPRKIKIIQTRRLVSSW